MSVTPEKAITVAKDLILFVGGLFGIFYQQYTNNVNPLLLLVFTTMTGIPGLMHVVSLWRAGGNIESSSQSRRDSQPPQD